MILTEERTTSTGSRRPLNVEPTSRIDILAAERAVRDLLTALGQDVSEPGLCDTPRRVAKMYGELFAGLNDEPARHLTRTFPEHCDEIVLLRDIDFASIFEHHLLPSIGRAHPAYLPFDSVVGLSKPARTVDAYARRPQVQERLTAQVADALMTHLQARGALVVVEAEHFCMKIRGVNKPNSVMVTSALRGHFKTDAAARAEAMALIGKRNGC